MATRDSNVLLSLDRRWIFLLVFLCVVIALLVDFPLPVKASRPVRDMHAAIEALAPASPAGQEQALAGDENAPAHKALLVSMDYDPASTPELEPMSAAVLTHALCRGVKVVGMTLNQHGQDLGERIIFSAAKTCGAQYGRDFVYLGYKPGDATLIINLGQDFHNAYNQDYRGVSTRELAVTRHIESLRDFGYVVSIASTAYWEFWVIFGQSRYGFSYGTGVTGVMAPDVFPFLQTGQVKGLLGGLVGAAEYESLIGRSGPATAGMRPQSAVHVLIVILVLFGNTVFFVELLRRRRKGGGR